MITSTEKLPKCTRCDHFACPHCTTFCDDLECVCYLEHDGKCVYTEPFSEALLKLFEEWHQRFPYGGMGCTDVTNEDGTVTLYAPGEYEALHPKEEDS